ncbi:type IV toxin-antitoxin system AbiEi family antitoxin domain-containing protein [Nocardioides limicola]|uniref:type IV toxin-antitoxin system AbiEi family antitoxin domain-containing protein n=1 Tax=Nocardioides limicola TaxID=2803368 RepID=UPI00193C03D4|nr:type IV toxin-antitoxin system AbiEi family antitoxin domain-containing protein [Nocardioides sp. DJM-14]
MAAVTLTTLGAIAEQRWGLLTTAQAEAAGVSRQQLSRWSTSGVLERVAQGVYRMAGAPPQDHESIYATWLALGGATSPAPTPGVSAVVAAGTTAAIVHGLGDFFLDEIDFIVPARKSTRLPGVKLRVKKLTRDEVFPVNGLPTLTVERTIADLVEQWVDLSLVADVVRDGVTSRKLAFPDALVSYLDPIARAQRRTDVGAGDGRVMASDLFELAGVYPERWDRG